MRFAPLNAGIIASWATCAGLLGGGYWYVEDSRRTLGGIHAEMQEIIADLKQYRDDEKTGDANWLDWEQGQFDSIRAGQAGIRSDHATSQDDLNYRLGMHVEQHRRIESLLERLESLERDWRGGRLADRHPD